ncbi:MULTISPECIES: histidine decarboxylase [Francisella]|uniref:Histidine decarboxylase n=1 Tax=Francisella opportunistica TaxID=2016517 RepID=A0A345JRS6_9GAMM|nr:MULTISPECIES: histidine decarboxylase [Francisella]APC91769.1 Histidine decarboxylase [Francisella sp. MA067296]AXH30022.1 histidine decarboxylase [Francisella opportunistica]AXH31666.1 histidine decarboxylase [Francisella opportunistica]AXH33312.1 histidine decarboxylase [Francisella opportunistica]
MKNIENLKFRLAHNKKVYIGYPTATDFNYDSCKELVSEHFNNIGNPYSKGSPFSTLGHERAVINFFLSLYMTNTNDSWGYIASCSSEAILYAVWNARNYFKTYDVTLIYSDYAHYCINKTANILGIKNKVIGSRSNGEIDLELLEHFLKENNKKNQAYIFVATIGSTITSSLDKHKEARNILKKYTDNFYVHLDGAFDGAFLPLKEPYIIGEDFESVNISGHKFLGGPMPSGILLIQKKYISQNYIEYIDNDDMTIGGSRNGLSAVLLYNRILSLGSKKGLTQRYQECLDKSKNFLEILKKNNIKAWKNPQAITIVLEDIDKKIFDKWHMPKYKNQATITCLPKLTKQMLLELIFDIRNPDKIDFSKAKRFAEDITPL